MRILFVCIFIPFILALFACKSNTRKTFEETPEKEVSESIKAADFCADSAYYFIKEQVNFGPRVPNTPSHEKCGIWLEKAFRKYTKNVIVQPFTARAYNGDKLNCKNIIASFAPQNPTRILLVSHWDSRPYADNDPDSTKHHTPIDGANDGASGVGVLLEIARQLRIFPAKVGVDILLVDAEDYGAPMDYNYTGTDDWALGSQYWSNNPHVPGYGARFGILFDMVGGENAVFTFEGTSLYYAPDVAQRIWSIGASIGYSDYFSTERTNAITDYHVYINQIRQVPTVDIIQHDPSTRSGFNQYWHTVKDNMSNISKPTLMAVGQTVLTTIYTIK